MTLFKDRSEAGKKLAEALSKYAGRTDVVILALPRGGVPVGFEIARALNAPLDVFLVRKLGVPGHEELAMGAIASGGVRVLNDDVVAAYGLSEEIINRAAIREGQQLSRREMLYRGSRPRMELEGKVAILVDDGLATGATMRAAVKAVKTFQPSHIVVATPTGAAEACGIFEGIVDEVECLTTPHPFAAIGFWYDDFSPTTDEEVQELLEHAAKGFRHYQAPAGERGESYKQRAFPVH